MQDSKQFKINKSRIILLGLTVFVFFLFSFFPFTFVNAQTSPSTPPSTPPSSPSKDLKYVPLVTDSPLTVDKVPIDGSGLGKLVNQYVKIAIQLAGMLAVIMIIVGGIQYVSTDSWSGKSDGKQRIQAALGGLALALASYIILNTINPTLTDLNFTIAKVELVPTTVGLTVDTTPESEVTEGPGGNPLGETGLPTTPGQVGDAQGPGNTTLQALQAKYGSLINLDSCTGLSEVRAEGRVSVADNSAAHVVGNISPEIAWLAIAVAKRYPTLHPSSTYRSPAHNTDVGGSPTSAHVRGEAVDFFTGQPRNPTTEGLALLARARGDICGIGIRQVIYNGTGYNLGGGTFSNEGHYDHVHIGR